MHSMHLTSLLFSFFFKFTNMYQIHCVFILSQNFWKIKWIPYHKAKILSYSVMIYKLPLRRNLILNLTESCCAKRLDPKLDYLWFVKHAVARFKKLIDSHFDFSCLLTGRCSWVFRFYCSTPRFWHQICVDEVKSAVNNMARYGQRPENALKRANG